jgi:3-oxoacyl-[acyl-carrier-protein] synthase-3
MSAARAVTYIHGLGHFHPENVIDNAFLEALDIGTNDTWILDRVGIRARRTVLPLDYIRATRNADPRAGFEAALYDDAETGARAARMAIARAGIDPGQIGLVVAGGCGPDMAIPVDAARIAEKLGIDVPCVDLSAACSTFGAHMSLIRPEGFALIVQAENLTRCIDYRDRSTAVLWGDGTSAAVISATEPARMRASGFVFGGRPSDWRKITIPRFGHFKQEGPAVQKFAIKQTRELVAATRAGARDPARLAFVGHQANLLVLQNVVRGLQLDPSRHFSNVVELGNTGASGAPSVLSQRWAEWQDGDEIAVAVVGGGLAWASMRIEVGAQP